MLKKLLALIFKRNNKTTSEVPVDEENRSFENLTGVEIHSPTKIDLNQAGAQVSRRLEDMSAESELAEFLDEFLYAPLLREGNFISIERMVEKEQQLQGIDVVVKTLKSVGYVDEKAQLYYINKNIPTFAFELQFLKMGRAIEGWFLNDNLKTDYYLLIWPCASIDDVKRLKKEDFTKLDALMVSKGKLRDKLSSLGLDKETLTKRTFEIRKSRTYGKITTGIQGIYYYASDPLKYVEAPINIVISKTRLISLSDAHYEITTDGFKRI